MSGLCLVPAVVRSIVREDNFEDDDEDFLLDV